MNPSTYIARHFRQIYLGGEENWVEANIKDEVSGLTWQQATTQIHDFNTIATLVFHLHYFVKVVTRVLEGGPLEGNDTLSFEAPSIESKESWEGFLTPVWAEAEHFATLIEQVPEAKLAEPFVDPKYSDYYYNLFGMIEHCHYHIGQIRLIKKLL